MLPLGKVNRIEVSKEPGDLLTSAFHKISNQVAYQLTD